MLFACPLTSCTTSGSTGALDLSLGEVSQELVDGCTDAVQPPDRALTNKEAAHYYAADHFGRHECFITARGAIGALQTIQRGLANATPPKR